MLCLMNGASLEILLLPSTLWVSHCSLNHLLHCKWCCIKGEMRFLMKNHLLLHFTCLHCLLYLHCCLPCLCHLLLCLAHHLCFQDKILHKQVDTKAPSRRVT